MTSLPAPTQRIDKCGTCGSLTGHTPIAAAECALAAAHRADLAGLAPNDRPLRVQLLDLYAHLRGVFPAPDAYRATRYVLELGWRPWVRSDAGASDSLPVSQRPGVTAGLGLVPPTVPNPIQEQQERINETN